MVQLSNTPRSATPLTLEARKSFSLGLWFQNADGEKVDLTGCTLKLVIANKARYQSTVVLTRSATQLTPELGFAQLDLQAADLDLPGREYDYWLTLTSAEGYSGVVLKGPLTVLPNADLIDDNVYSSVQPSQSLTVKMMGRQVISVIINHLLAPGIAIGTVTTTGPGGEAGAEIVGSYPYLLLNLSIPIGEKGERGLPGITGDKGDRGDTGLTGSVGPAGPPPTITIGTVTQAAPGNPPAASISGNAVSGYQLNLVIPPPAGGGGGGGSLVTLSANGDGTGKVDVDFSSSLDVLLKPTGFGALASGTYGLVMDGSGHWTGLVAVVTTTSLSSATFDGGSL